ncbi:ParB/RepB/Spo0J family partition protein [Pararhizobium haloflavum]|uniref:ParB/RepB/Spo0J family partition protein n=1 Tax=Pararhizobium haloflavum TaxID=2037914 RepID=UPI000C176000|nr:ParB/RepB/Spo0J family partition protein [Pararhizobium haloflavum]
MTESKFIPLNKLDADPKNVRKTYSAEGVEQLAASLLAKGQLQNIIVRTGDKKGRFYVTAGGRRLKAFQHLAETGKIAKDLPIECKERAAEDATEISLAENVMRETMHRADEFEAFLTLAEAGQTPSHIAERFGVSELIVNRRLALARVAPEIFALYRGNEISFEQLTAFTITDDHARQVEVWESLPTYSRHANTIKRMLASEEVPANDKRVQFIGGLDAYEAAGGSVRRDLFDPEDGGYATDSGLVDKLVLAKLEAHADPVRAEGWKWVEVHTERPDDIFSFGRVYPDQTPLPEADQARLDQLSEEHDSLAELIEADAADENAEPRLEAVQAEMDALQNKQEAFSADNLATSGAMVFIDYYGRATVERGLVRREDTATTNPSSTTEVEGEEASGPAPIVLKHSATLIEDLIAQKTAALRVELADNPDIALAAVVHALLLGSVFRHASEHSALQISLTYERHEGAMKQPENNKAAIAFAELQETFGHQIPGNPADLWEWCLDQHREQLLSLLAFAASHSLNAMEPKFHGRTKGVAHANQIGKALNVDMRDWFETTGGSYFMHLNRTSIQAAVAEVRGSDFADGIAAMKKPEAVDYAHKAVKESGWLPAPIRVTAPEAEDNESAEIHQFPVAAD